MCPFLYPAIIQLSQPSALNYYPIGKQHFIDIIIIHIPIGTCWRSLEENLNLQQQMVSRWFYRCYRYTSFHRHHNYLLLFIMKDNYYFYIKSTGNPVNNDQFQFALNTLIVLLTFNKIGTCQK